MKKTETRRNFLKKVVISGTGSVTFVKAASAAAEPSLPAIVSLLLDDENTPIEETVFDPLASPVNQDIEIPAAANFMHVDARGAGGGGSDSIFFFNEDIELAAGTDGGNGGRAMAVFDLRPGSSFEGLGGTPVAQVGTGGGVGDFAEAGASGGVGGQFDGGQGGRADLKNGINQLDGGTAGGGGGGRAAIVVAESPIIVAGGGGGAGGGVGGSSSAALFAGGKGGDGGAFDDAEKRAGEDGFGAAIPALGGNRSFLGGGTRGAVSDSAGGIGANTNESANGFAGEGRLGGDGGRSFDDSGSLGAGSGGGGGSGFTFEISGAGGGGGGGDSSGGGGGAAGANFVNAEVAMPGFSVDAGVGGAGGRGGLAGETAETAAADRFGEAGAPAQIIVTFFKDEPS